MMATPSDSPKKLLPSLLVLLGAFLLVAAILIPAYVVPKLSVTPLTIGPNNRGRTYTTATDTGTAFDTASYLKQQPTAQNADRPECQHPAGLTGRLPMFCFMDTAVPITSRTTVFGAEPASAQVNTFHANYTLWRTDRKTVEDGLLSSYIDRVTTNRRSGKPVGESIIYPNARSPHLGANEPIKPFERTGYQYKFPFNMKLDGTYSYFDPFVLSAHKLTPVQETQVGGIKALEFKQVVGPVNLYKVWEKALRDEYGHLSDVDQLTLSTMKFNEPERVWKNDSSTQIVPYYAYYYTQRTLVISQATGQILKKDEFLQKFAAKNDASARAFISQNGMKSGLDNPTATLVEVHAVMSPQDTEAVLSNERSSYAMLQGANVATWVLGLLGLILLAFGWIVVVRRHS